MRIIITIKSSWVFSDGGERGNIIHQIEKALVNKWDDNIRITKAGLFDCEMTYYGRNTSREMAFQCKMIIEEATREPYDDNTFAITIEDGNESYRVKKEGSLERNNLSENDIFAQINALQGIKAESSYQQKKNEDSEKIPIKAETTTSFEVGTPAKKQTEQQENSLPKEAKIVYAKKQSEVEENDKSALNQIHNLVGSAEFKKLADEVNLTAEYTIKNKTQSIFFSETYLFSINTGSGYHTSLSLYSKLLSEVKLFGGAVPSEMITIPSFDDKEVSIKMNNALSVLENAFSRQRLICIDLTEWIGHTNSKELKKLLMTVFRDNDKCAVIFRVPYVKTAVLSEIIKDLEDIVSVRPVVFEPFNDEELREVASRYLAKHAFDLSSEAWKVFDERIQAEKSNGYFYGVHTVHKVVGDIIRKKELLGAKHGKTDKHITEEIREMVAVDIDKEKTDHIKELRSMIGMEVITERVIEIINQIVYARNNHLRTKPTMHMCFVGNPGTGKTTVARIIGQILKERGILRIGKFFEHHARDLCGQYVGQTAPKTHAICEEAYGSVLFLDEAYSLATDGDQHNYGREAIDTLIAEMENHKDDLVVIFAGYPDEIEKMISLNPGMRSRIPYTIEFPSYTPKQLTNIFKKMLDESFSYTDDLLENVKDYFESLPTNMLSEKTFGNGRFVRNLFERTWGKAIVRTSENGFDSLVINSDDFAAAVNDMNLPGKRINNQRIGFR